MSMDLIRSITDLHIPKGKLLQHDDLTAAMNMAAVIVRSLLNQECLPYDLVTNEAIAKKGTMLGNHFESKEINAGLQNIQEQLAGSVYMDAQRNWDIKYRAASRRSEDAENMKFEVVSIAATKVLKEIERFNKDGMNYSGSTFIGKVVAEVFGAKYRTNEIKRFEAVYMSTMEVANKLEIDPEMVSDRQVLDQLATHGPNQIASEKTVGDFRRRYYNERQKESLSNLTSEGSSFEDLMPDKKNYIDDLLDQLETQECLEQGEESLFGQFTATELALLIAFRINKNAEVIPYFVDGELLPQDQLFKAVVGSDAKYRDRLLDEEGNIKLVEFAKVRNQVLQRIRSIISRATGMGPERGIGLDKWVKESSDVEIGKFHEKGMAFLPLISRDLDSFENYLHKLELDNYTPQTYDEFCINSSKKFREN